MKDPTLSERLSSYLDGELDGDGVAEIENLLAQDASLRQELDRLRELRGLVTGAFGQLLQEPVPLELAGKVRRCLSENDDGTDGTTQSTVSGESRAKNWTTALAAASIAGVLAFSGGYLLSNSVHKSRLADLREQLDADRQVFATIINQTLEKHLSGEVVEWENEKSGSSGSVRPVRTFRNNNGEWCREYKEQLVLGDERWSRSAIACRIGEGQWDTRVFSLDDS